MSHVRPPLELNLRRATAQGPQVPGPLAGIVHLFFLAQSASPAQLVLHTATTSHAYGAHSVRAVAWVHCPATQVAAAR